MAPIQKLIEAYRGWIKASNKKKSKKEQEPESAKTLSRFMEERGLSLKEKEALCAALSKDKTSNKLGLAKEYEKMPKDMKKKKGMRQFKARDEERVKKGYRERTEEELNNVSRMVDACLLQY